MGFGTTTWNTHSEINFIDGLGGHAHSRPTDEARLALLQGYKEGLLHRAFWTGLDRDLITAHVNNRVRELERREQ